MGNLQTGIDLHLCCCARWCGARDTFRRSVECWHRIEYWRTKTALPAPPAQFAHSLGQTMRRGFTVLRRHAASSPVVSDAVFTSEWCTALARAHVAYTRPDMSWIVADRWFRVAAAAAGSVETQQVSTNITASTAWRT